MINTKEILLRQKQYNRLKDIILSKEALEDIINWSATIISNDYRLWVEFNPIKTQSEIFDSIPINHDKQISKKK